MERKLVYLFFTDSLTNFYYIINNDIYKRGISFTMKKFKFSWIDIIIIILFLLSLYLILTRIFGHSATDLTITISLFTFLGSLVFKLTYFILNFNREFGEFKIKSINSFDNIKEDISLIKKKLKV